MEAADLPKLEVGCGSSHSENAFDAGVEAGRQALASISTQPLSVVLVFGSVRFNLEELLTGICSVTGDAPLLGSTTAGEICDGPKHGTVVVVALASPFLSVSVGIGKAVSQDWERAVQDAVGTTGLRRFFSSDSQAQWAELAQEGKSACAILFSPGNTGQTSSQSFEILEKLKELSEGRLPIFGGSAADDWRMERNSVLLGRRAFPDSMLVAVLELQLRFGIGLDHGFRPGQRRATVTRSRGHDVLQLDERPAANVYAELLGTPKESLVGKHLTLTTGRPAGTPDPYGQYSINVASFFTPEEGVRFTQPVAEGTSLTIMEADTDRLIAAGRGALRKALLRGDIVDPAVVLVFSCALRSRILGDRTGEELSGIQGMLPGVPIAGFYSFGEQGVADDGVNRHNNEVIAVLVLGRELSYAAEVAAENRRLANALRKGEARFRSLVETAPSVILCLSPEGRILEFNPEAERLYGRTRAEVMGRSYLDLFLSPKAHRQVAADIRKIVHGDRTHVYENSITGADGRRHLLSWNVDRLLDGQGDLVGIVAVGQDITDREEIEGKVRLSEVKYRTLFDRAYDAILVFDPDDETILEANRQASVIYGFSQDELIGKSLDLLQPPERRGREKTMEILGNTEGRGFELAHHRKDGTPVFVEVSAGIVDYGGRPAILSINRDITDRKRAQEALRESEARYHDLYHNAPDMFVSVDAATGEIVECNQTLAEFLGREREGIIGRPVLELYHPDCTDAAREAFQSFVDTGVVRNAELQMKRHDGSRADVSLNVRAVRGEDGSILQSCSVLRDITERKRVEVELARHRNHLEELVGERTRELEASRDQLRRSERLASIGTLAAGIAHEINNPVGVVLLAAENALSILGQPESSERLEKCLHDIVDAAERCDHITTSVLRFAKHQDATKVLIDLNSVVERAVLLTRRYVKENRGELELQLTEDLPKVPANSVELEQVFVNLIQNAVEAAAGRVRLTVRTEEAAAAVSVVIMDDGPGIPADQVGHVFDPFFTTRRQGGGTGLGLSIVHSIIKGHGGTIDVESTPPKGAVFTIKLPLAAAHNPEAENVESANSRG